MFSQILSAVRSANHYQLQNFLARNPPEFYARMHAGFAQHMTNIAEFCMQGYQGAGTLSTTFIRELHRQLFPPGYREVSETVQGQEVLTMVPGEYKRLPNAVDSRAFPGTVIWFTPPERVAEEMDTLVARVNRQLSAPQSADEQRDLILWFVLDFFSIHPFNDANGRLADILCDLLLIKANLPPMQLAELKEIDKEGFCRACGLSERARDITHLREFVARNSAQRENSCRSIG